MFAQLIQKPNLSLGNVRPENMKSAFLRNYLHFKISKFQNRQTNIMWQNFILLDIHALNLEHISDVP